MSKFENFEKSAANLASSTAGGNLKFERADWTSFRTIEGLQQKAGVDQSKLRRLVLKELTDNALDTGTSVSVGEISGGYFVTDKGPGIDPGEVARLFSINRPLVSTKLLRLPTRGALGNGLRVVAGAVLASAGFLTLTSRNRRFELRPERDGSTSVVAMTACDHPEGARVELGFGPDLPQDPLTLVWAQISIDLARGGDSYAGKSSPWWYDAPQFHELLSANSAATARELVSQLDGCAGGRAGDIVSEAGLGRMACRDVDRAQAERLLKAARAHAKLVNPKRLGAVGPEGFPSYAYAIAYGATKFGSSPLEAVIPFVVEAWVGAGRNTAVVNVNRTPIAADLRLYREKSDLDLFGCGLAHTVAKAGPGRNFTLCLNVTTPYMPITSDGKEPNLKPFVNAIIEATSKAVRTTRGVNASAVSQKDVVLNHLDEVIAAVSGVEGYRFNSRQLFYALRPIVMNETGRELQLGNFTRIIDDYEKEEGEIPLMYREPRGSITHPHRDETISLSTLTVEQYKRPAWTFNKLLYIEKEGAQEALKQDRWGERNDCAVMSSKGFSTRAARDLIDKLVEHDEPIEVFCAHDADAAGTMIYQTLQDETRARGARKITIINIGLEPWEAATMRLEVETLEVDTNARRKPVANYIRHEDGDWDEWLQTHRVELNAMTTPELIGWLDRKMHEFGAGKLIPPADVLEEDLAERTREKVRAAIADRILREAGWDALVEAAMAALELPDGDELTRGVAQLFEDRPDAESRDHVEAVANRRAG
jgi:hypothetical protein